MSSPPEPIVQSDVHDDAVRAIRVMAVKAAIFLTVALISALIAVWWQLG
jgi:hypothetical protein